MKKPFRAAASWPLSLILAAALLAGCGGSSSLPDLGAPAAMRTRPPVLFHDVPEMLFLQPLDPLPDGPAAELRGVYGAGGAGDNSLTLCQLEGGQLHCNRIAAGLDATGPLLVEASGQINGPTLSAGSWQALEWDEAGQRAAAQAELEKQAAVLAGYDWAAIARSDFTESTGWFNGDEARFRTLPLELYGYDTASKRIIWRAQGWEFPQQKHLVHRYPVIYVVTDPAGKKPAEVFVTIEGYAEE